MPQQERVRIAVVPPIQSALQTTLPPRSPPIQASPPPHATPTRLDAGSSRVQAGRRMCRSIYLSHLATTHLSNILCVLKRFVGRGFSRDIPVSEKRGFRAFCVTTFFVGKPRKRKIAAAPAFPNLRMQHLVPQSPPCHTPALR